MLLSSGVDRYWALVTNINLKGEMNGWDLARQVRESDPAFPVVYMTGGRRPMAITRRAKQHPAPKAVRAGATIYGGFQSPQLRTSLSADLTTDRFPPVGAIMKRPPVPATGSA